MHIGKHLKYIFLQLFLTVLRATFGAFYYFYRHLIQILFDIRHTRNLRLYLCLSELLLHFCSVFVIDALHNEVRNGAYPYWRMKPEGWLGKLRITGMHEKVISLRRLSRLYSKND